jgi:sulfite reductase beta subunit-like hemoprotein
VSCPGADTCNLAVTQSRGLASAISESIEEAGLGDVTGVRINISGCTNSCGQHHVSDIGFMGVERRAHGQAAPGYQMLIGGHLADTMVAFGQKALRLPAKNCGEAAVRVIGKYATERQMQESLPAWMERIGGVKVLADELRDLDFFPKPDEGPEYYIDYDETGPYVAETGESECAT